MNRSIVKNIVYLVVRITVVGPMSDLTRQTNTPYYKTEARGNDFLDEREEGNLTSTQM